jgi:predicted metalloprotease
VLPAEFFDRIWQQDADAAVVVVVAHEWGHHVQRLLGITSADFFTIQIELQADCLGGVFFNYANQQGWLDAGDLDEALAMSWSGGDPVLVAWFEEGAHGSPQQRVAAFRRGFQGQESCAVYTS